MMNHIQFREARHKLGLSVVHLARMLGVTDTQIRRMEADPKYRSSRPVTRPTENLMKAFLAGYRPKNWPTE